MSLGDSHSGAPAGAPAPDPSGGHPLGHEPVAEGADFAASYAVKLPVFEGPLDLLLHLIRQNEMEITDIPIALVADQYLRFLDIMRELNLDVAGEYLVMAASLALIKSRMLLPPEASEEEEEALDPRAELVARLLEYQRFKEVAEGLGQRRLLDRDVYAVSAAGPGPTPDSEREIAVGLFDLISAFKSVLDGAEKPAPHEVETEVVTVRDQMHFVMEELDRVETVEFRDLFTRPDGRPPSRSLLVATFLAILELARLAALHIYQSASEEGAPEGPIRLRPVGDTGDGLTWRERITDTM